MNAVSGTPINGRSLRASILLAIAVAVNFGNGCGRIKVEDQAFPVAAPTQGAYVAPTAAVARRVLIVPIQNRTRYQSAGIEFTQELENQLRAAGLFEVVALNRHNFDRNSPQIMTGRGFHEGIIADLAREYRVDGVLIAELTDYQPYWPQRAGLKLHIIDPGESRVLVSVDGQWDAQQRATAAEIKAQHAQLETSYGLRDQDIALYSPRIFRGYVVRKVVDSIGGRQAGAATTILEDCPAPVTARPFFIRPLLR